MNMNAFNNLLMTEETISFIEVYLCVAILFEKVQFVLIDRILKWSVVGSGVIYFFS